jgi:hypothetical protein
VGLEVKEKVSTVSNCQNDGEGMGQSSSRWSVGRSFSPDNYQFIFGTKKRLTGSELFPDVLFSVPLLNLYGAIIM